MSRLSDYVEVRPNILVSEKKLSHPETRKLIRWFDDARIADKRAEGKSLTPYEWARHLLARYRGWKARRMCMRIGKKGGGDGS